MAKVGSVVIELTAKTAKLEADLKRVRAQLTGFRRAAASNTAALRTLALQAGAVFAAFGGTRALVQKTREIMLSTDQLAKTADGLMVTTEALQAMQHAGELFGASADDLSRSLRKMNVNIGEALKGGTQQAESFRTLGLEARKLAQAGTEEAYYQIAEAISQLRNPAQQAEIAVSLFGKEAQSMLRLLAGGRSVIEHARQEMERLGLSINRVDSNKIEQADDALLRLQRIFDHVFRRISVALAPAIVGLAEEMFKLSEKTQGFKGVFESVIERVLWISGKVADVWRGWQVILKSIEYFWSLFFLGMVSAWTKIKLIGSQIGNSLIEGVNAAIAGLNSLSAASIKVVNAVIYGMTFAFNVAIEGYNILIGNAVKNVNKLIDLVNKVANTSIKKLADDFGQLSELEPPKFSTDALKVDPIKFRFDFDVADASDKLDNWVKASAEIYAELIELMEKPMPSEEIKKWFEASKEKVQAAAEQAAEIAQSNLENIEIVDRRLIESIEGSWKNFFENSSKAIGEWATGTKVQFKDLLRSLVSEMIASIVKFQLLMPIMNWFGGTKLGGMLGMPSDITDGLKTRASGGPVSAGTPYLVGEEGPELMVPGASGTIIPTHALAAVGRGSGGTFIIDARGADRTGLARLEAMIYALNGSIENRAVSAVVNARDRRIGGLA